MSFNWSAFASVFLLIWSVASTNETDSRETDDEEKFRQPFAVIYNDQEARHLWKVASSVYLLNTSSSLFNKCVYDELKFSTTRGETTYLWVLCNRYTDVDCIYLFATDHQAKTIHFTGMGLGSENFHEYYRDRRREKKQFKELLVHETVYEQFNWIWNVVNAHISWLELHQLYPTYRFVITGHQVGGLLAQLIAYDVVSSGEVPSSQVMVRTFGAPKGFAWGNYTDVYMKAVPNTFHITQHGDDVPRQPLKGFREVDYHLKEIYYADGMGKGANYTICKGQADPDCSQGPANEDATIEANNAYFGHHFMNACFADD